MTDRPFVFIATPCYGGLLHQGWVTSLLATIQYADPAGFDVTLAMLGNDSLVTRSRNTLLAQFRAFEPATHLLFVDADITFDPMQIQRMLLADKEVVAGIYPFKVLNNGPAADRHLADGESPDTAPLAYVGTPETGDAYRREGDFVTASYAGTGFMMIRRDAVERLIAAYPETAYRTAATATTNVPAHQAHALFECMIDPETGLYLSEDYGFCWRWRAIGGRIWLDLQGQLGHTGAHEFHGEPFTRFGSLPATR